MKNFFTITSMVLAINSIGQPLTGKIPGIGIQDNIISAKSYAQSKNYIDLPYIETIGKVDSLVVPDKIYLNIIISEKDTKGKISVEEQETKMYEKLKSIGIATEKQISLNDMFSFITVRDKNER